jgi:hypothetical protein
VCGGGGREILTFNILLHTKAVIDFEPPIKIYYK